MRRWVRGLAAILMMALTLAMIGCADDLYGQCDINPDDELLRDCANSDQASCVVEEQLECQTRVCGKYRGSDPFCTIQCVTNDDCPAGQCREFVFQSGRSYCVANVDLDE